MAVAAKESDEAAAVRERYGRRHDDNHRYSPLDPAVLLATQERQGAIADLFLNLGLVRSDRIAAARGRLWNGLQPAGVHPVWLQARASAGYKTVE